MWPKGWLCHRHLSSTLQVRAGVVHPWGSIQTEISENQSFLALLWKMGILTFYLENYIDLFSTSSNWEERKLCTMEASFLFKDWCFTQIIDDIGVIDTLETELQVLIKCGILGSLKYKWFCCCKEHKSFMIVLYDEALDNVLISFSNLFPSNEQKDSKYSLCHHNARSNYRLGGNLMVLSLTF